MSPARRHRERMLGLAAASAAPAEVRAGPAASEQQLQLARLGVDLRRLHDFQSVERKIELKRELLPEYAAWVDGVLAATDVARGFRDDVLTYVMIWRLDVGDYAGALPIAEFVLRHDVPLPERFDRTAPTLICEEIAEAALKRLGQDQDFDIDLLFRVEQLVFGCDIFDQVRAKLHKAIGLELARQADTIAPDADGPAGAKRARAEAAIANLGRALQLDPSCGVKQRHDRLTKATAKLSTPET